MGITAIEMAQGKPPHVGLTEFDVIITLKTIYKKALLSFISYTHNKLYSKRR